MSARSMLAGTDAEVAESRRAVAKLASGAVHNSPRWKRGSSTSPGRSVLRDSDIRAMARRRPRGIFTSSDEDDEQQKTRPVPRQALPARAQPPQARADVLGMRGTSGPATSPGRSIVRDTGVRAVARGPRGIVSSSNDDDADHDSVDSAQAEAEEEEIRLLEEELRKRGQKRQGLPAVQHSQASEPIAEAAAKARHTAGRRASDDSRAQDRPRGLQPLESQFTISSPTLPTPRHERSLAEKAWLAAKDHAAADQWVQAIKALDSALAHGHPHADLCHHARGIAHEHIGQLHASLQDFSAAARLDPVNHLALYHCGQKQWQLGDLVAAVQSFRTCLELQPHNQDYSRDLRSVQNALHTVQIGSGRLMWCIERATLRAESSLDSDVVGELVPGEAVVVLQTEQIWEQVAGRRRVRHRVRCLPWQGPADESRLPSTVQGAWASVESSDGVQLLIDEPERKSKASIGVAYRQMRPAQKIRSPDADSDKGVYDRRHGTEVRQELQTHRERFLQQGQRQRHRHLDNYMQDAEIVRAERPVHQKQHSHNQHQHGGRPESRRQEAERQTHPPVKQPVQNDQDRLVKQRQQLQERLIQEEIRKMRAQQQVHRLQSVQASKQSPQAPDQRMQLQQMQSTQLPAPQLSLQERWGLEEAAATQVQAAFRGRHARLEYEEMLIQKEMDRLRAREAQEQRRRQQSVERRRREAELRLQQHNWRSEEVAATNVQAVYRGHRTRKHYKEQWVEAEMEAAATNVQAAYRGHRARKDYKERCVEAEHMHATNSARTRPLLSHTDQRASWMQAELDTASVTANSRPVSPGKSPDPQRSVSPLTSQWGPRASTRRVGSPRGARHMAPSPNRQPWSTHSPTGFSRAASHPASPPMRSAVQTDDRFSWPFEPWEVSVSLERFLEQIEIDPMLQQATGIGPPPPVSTFAAHTSYASISANAETIGERTSHRRRISSPTRRNGRRSPRLLMETSRKEGTWCHAEHPVNTKVMSRSVSRLPEDNPISPPRRYFDEDNRRLDFETPAEAEPYTEPVSQHVQLRAAEQRETAARSHHYAVTAAAPPPPPPPAPVTSLSSASQSLSLIPAASLSEQEKRVDSGEVQRGALLFELKRNASGWGSQPHNELIPAAVLRESAVGTDVVTPTDRELRQAASVLRSTPSPAPKPKKAPPPSPRMRGSDGVGGGGGSTAQGQQDQSPRRRRSAPPLSALPGPARAGGEVAGLAQRASPPPFPDGRVPALRSS